MTSKWEGAVATVRLATCDDYDIDGRVVTILGRARRRIPRQEAT